LSRKIYTPETYVGYSEVFSDIGKVIDSLITNTFTLEQKNYLQTIEKQDDRFKFFDYTAIKNGDTTSETSGFTDLSFSH
jgi:hypothetical protein